MSTTKSKKFLTLEASASDLDLLAESVDKISPEAATLIDKAAHVLRTGIEKVSKGSSKNKTAKYIPYTRNEVVEAKKIHRAMVKAGKVKLAANFLKLAEEMEELVDKEEGKADEASMEESSEAAADESEPMESEEAPSEEVSEGESEDESEGHKVEASLARLRRQAEAEMDSSEEEEEVSEEASEEDLGERTAALRNKFYRMGKLVQAEEEAEAAAADESEEASESEESEAMESEEEGSEEVSEEESEEAPEPPAAKEATYRKVIASLRKSGNHKLARAVKELLPEEKPSRRNRR